ncbi:MAG: prepilin-type N-terminal cleavage/methylation domain-containing protein [Caldisericia bacterium]
MSRRSGFTLIEVMIVVAVTVILLGAVFAVNFRITDLWRSERVRQALQQNFRFAADMITTDLRQAVPTKTTSLGTPTAINEPAQNVLGDVLEFYMIDPHDPSRRLHINYQRKVVAGSDPQLCYIERSESKFVDLDLDGVWIETGTATSLPVTEEISSLAALHFIQRGSRVVTILVAQYGSGGAAQTVSYTLQTSVRTLYDGT